MRKKGGAAPAMRKTGFASPSPVAERHPPPLGEEQTPPSPPQAAVTPPLTGEARASVITASGGDTSPYRGGKGLRHHRKRWRHLPLQGRQARAGVIHEAPVLPPPARGRQGGRAQEGPCVLGRFPATRRGQALSFRRSVLAALGDLIRPLRRHLLPAGRRLIRNQRIAVFRLL